MLFIIIIGFMIASLVVSTRLKNKFKKYSKIPLSTGLTGREIAELMLADHGIHDVKVMSVQGQLTDHYNPTNKTVNLSPDVYNGRSAAAAAVASHECGHAVQHATAYSFLEFRSAMVPIQNISGQIINVVFMMMFFGAFLLPSIIPFNLAILVIIACYGVFTLFAFITLPVEFDASKRALAWIQDRNIVNTGEHKMAKDALDTAAKTYVIAALSALATLLYWVMIYLGGSRD
ncbi:zinc metallopeptidase [Marinoscillum sp. 108]|uniref:zinc metallopeptidase n=1 Tax=Marinoscillum sp. 108 TaxID=2653151 RepID=UPI0012F3E813|nr:zinc metallopeptidase [Marinoscillum sp. 108]VXD19672.1 putative membrane protease YugP [Marinoscillum sp. 108]